MPNRPEIPNNHPEAPKKFLTRVNEQLKKQTNAGLVTIFTSAGVISGDIVALTDMPATTPRDVLLYAASGAIYGFLAGTGVILIRDEE